jgi:hypothetical protein
MQTERQDDAPRRAESRDELVARVTREQEELHPSPVYTAASKRRLRIFLWAIGPISIVLGWLSGRFFGWDTLEWLGAAAGLSLALAYIGYVVITERDDGRVNEDVQRLMREREAAETAAGPTGKARQAP